MRTNDANYNLTPEQNRAADLHFQQRLGEALSATEQAELDAVPAETAAVLGQLEQTDQALTKVAQVARPGADFTRKVMAALPQQPSAGDRQFFTPEKRSARGRGFWLAAGLAAAVALAVIGARLMPGQTAPGVQPASAQVVKGGLTDASGRKVDRIEAGQRYRTGSEEVVVKLDKHSLVRLTANTEFEALPDAAGSERGMVLRQGSLYLNEAGVAPLLVRADDFDTEVREGVAWVMQDAANTQRTVPQGIVMVFQGQAQVHVTQLGTTLTVGEGELYVSGQPVEAVETFMAEAPARAEALEASQPEAHHKKRARYKSVVEGYREDLKSLESAIAGTSDPVRLAEMHTRRARVRELLDQHRRSLEGMSTVDDEAPVRARSLRETLEKVRQGKEGYSNPSTWM